MSTTSKALIWATGLITAAIFMQAQEMSDAASFGVIAGLTGAAWGSLNAKAGSARSCLR